MATQTEYCEFTKPAHELQVGQTFKWYGDGLYGITSIEHVAPKNAARGGAYMQTKAIGDNGASRSFRLPVEMNVTVVEEWQ